MKTDLYTKAVLTVIAISLAGIAVQLTTKDANAQSFSKDGIQRVVICSENMERGVIPICANVGLNGGLKVEPAR